MRVTTRQIHLSSLTKVTAFTSLARSDLLPTTTLVALRTVTRDFLHHNHRHTTSVYKDVFSRWNLLFFFIPPTTSPNLPTICNHHHHPQAHTPDVNITTIKYLFQHIKCCQHYSNDHQPQFRLRVPSVSLSAAATLPLSSTLSSSARSPLPKQPRSKATTTGS